MTGRNFAIDSLHNDPGIEEARRLVTDIRQRGFQVFYNLTSVKIIGNGAHSPTAQDMDTLETMHHEIGVLFALDTLLKHFRANAQALILIKECQQASKGVVKVKRSLLAKSRKKAIVQNSLDGSLSV